MFCAFDAVVFFWFITSLVAVQHQSIDAFASCFSTLFGFVHSPKIKFKPQTTMTESRDSAFEEEELFEVSTQGMSLAGWGAAGAGQLGIGETGACLRAVFDKSLTPLVSSNILLLLLWNHCIHAPSVLFFSLPTLFFPVLLGCVACALCFCDRWCGQDMDNPGAACRQQQHHFTPGHRVLPQPHGHASRSAQATPH